MGPNSRLASASRAKTIVDEMLHVGDEHRAWSWISASTSHGFQPSLMAVLASAMAAAVASASPRKTFTGDAWRSAIAPKISGETNAASADGGEGERFDRRASPWASSTVLNGTNHMPSAAP